MLSGTLFIYVAHRCMAIAWACDAACALINWAQTAVIAVASPVAVGWCVRDLLSSCRLTVTFSFVY